MLQQLSRYITENQASPGLFSSIRQLWRKQLDVNAMLLNMEAENAIELSPAILDTMADAEKIEVQVRPFSITRQELADTFPRQYDRQRFLRSTENATLRRKVLAHHTYSFIALTRDADAAECIKKFSFIRLDERADYILCTEQDVSRILEHDLLTGGLNRTGLLRELQERFLGKADSEPYAILYFNILDFRAINELYGTDMGDHILQHLYTTLTYSSLRPMTYARTESDNFYLLVRQSDIDHQLISSLCHQQYTEGDVTVSYRCVCGIYVIDDLTIAPSLACLRALQAAKHSKDAFTVPYVYFRPEMQKADFTAAQIMGQLDYALEHREFIPYFQPIVHAATGRIVMAEALVRWRSSAYGMVSPAQFIPVLERHGGLSRVDLCMAQQIFEFQQHRLQHQLPTVPIDINLSWVDFADKRLYEQIDLHLSSPTVPNNFLRYEITESALAEIIENRHELMNIFNRHDVKLIIDDFGQAYSFGTMRDVDFFIVKLDKTLIDKIGQSRKVDMLVDTLIGMFHKMDAKVVAEGVETKEQADYLARIGCDYIQGFYFYRPMDLEAFCAELDRQWSEVRNSSTDRAQLAAGAEELHAEDNVWIEREVLEEQNAQLSKSLAESRCLHMLLDKQDIHSFEWDIRTHIDHASDRFRDMYHLPSNEIPDMPDNAILCHPDDRRRFEDLYHRSEAGELMGDDYFRMLSPDGSHYIWFHKTFYTIFDRHNRPYKTIMTMQDCTDRFQERSVRERDALLIQQQDITTFIYTVADDCLITRYLGADGEIKTDIREHYISADEEHSTANQRLLAPLIRKHIADTTLSHKGFYDFFDSRTQTERRIHYAMVDAEYGQLYAFVGQVEDINKTRDRLRATIKAQQELLNVTQSLQRIYNAYTYANIKEGTARVMVLDEAYQGNLSADMEWDVINSAYVQNVLLPEHAQAFIDFMDLTTIDQRMGQDKYLMLEYEDRALGWIRGFLIPTEHDAEGHITNVIFASQVISKEKSTMERLIRLSEIDGLTQIRNRYSGEREIKAVLSNRQPGVFGIIDCDKFKEVNDTYGHRVGDELLIGVAQAMMANNHEGINMRLGGDEFAFFVRGVHTDEEIRQHIAHLFDYIDRLQISGMVGHRPTISVGAVHCSGDTLDFDTLYRSADALLYESKKYDGNKLTL